MANMANDAAVNRHGYAVMELARILYEKMEHLDGSGWTTWDELSDRDVEFYALCVESMIDHSTLLQMAMADNDVIFPATQGGIL